MKHDMKTDQGENLAYFEPARPPCDGEKTDACVACEEMVADWYNEEKDYDYSTGKPKTPGSVVLHFTQVVWKATVRVGVGFAISKNNKFYTVARYAPKGNMGGEFTTNVLAPKK